MGEFGYGNAKSWSKVMIRMPVNKVESSIKFFRENGCDTCKVIPVVIRFFVDCCENSGFHICSTKGNAFGQFRVQGIFPFRIDSGVSEAEDGSVIFNLVTKAIAQLSA